MQLHEHAIRTLAEALIKQECARYLEWCATNLRHRAQKRKKRSRERLALEEAARCVQEMSKHITYDRAPSGR
jgi:hypothetical protein